MPAPTFIDACTLPGSVTVLTSDDDTATLPAVLPFAFAFFGSPVAMYWVNTNGVMGFDGSPSVLPRVACQLPNANPDPHPAIYAFGDDLVTRPSGICIATSAINPNRQLVVTWESAALKSNSSSNLTFSIVLTENVNTVELMYGRMTGKGSEVQGALATIGLEDAAGTDAVQFSCQQTAVTMTPFDVVFTPK